MGQASNIVIVHSNTAQASEFASFFQNAGEYVTKTVAVTEVGSALTDVDLVVSGLQGADLNELQRALSRQEQSPPLLNVGAGFTDQMSGWLHSSTVTQVVPTPVRTFVGKAEQLIDYCKTRPNAECGILYDDFATLFLLRSVAAARKTGILFLRRGLRTGKIQYHQGKVTLAQSGKRVGQDAFNMVMAWPNCQYEFRRETSSLRNQQPMNATSESLQEGMKFLRDIAEGSQGYFALHDVFVRDPKGNPTLQSASIMYLFDGIRTVADVMDESSLSPLDTIRRIKRLWMRKSLQKKGQSTSSRNKVSRTSASSLLAQELVASSFEPVVSKHVDSQLQGGGEDVSEKTISRKSEQNAANILDEYTSGTIGKTVRKDPTLVGAAAPILHTDREIESLDMVEDLSEFISEVEDLAEEQPTFSREDTAEQTSISNRYLDKYLDVGESNSIDAQAFPIATEVVPSTQQEPRVAKYDQKTHSKPEAKTQSWVRKTMRIFSPGFGKVIQRRNKLGALASTVDSASSDTDSSLHVVTVDSQHQGDMLKGKPAFSTEGYSPDNTPDNSPDNTPDNTIEQKLDTVVSSGNNNTSISKAPKLPQPIANTPRDTVEMKIKPIVEGTDSTKDPEPDGVSLTTDNLEAASEPDATESVPNLAPLSGAGATTDATIVCDGALQEDTSEKTDLVAQSRQRLASKLAVDGNIADALPNVGSLVVDKKEIVVRSTDVTDKNIGVETTKGGTLNKAEEVLRVPSGRLAAEQADSGQVVIAMDLVQEAGHKLKPSEQQEQKGNTSLEVTDAKPRQTKTLFVEDSSDSQASDLVTGDLPAEPVDKELLSPAIVSSVSSVSLGTDDGVAATGNLLQDMAAAEIQDSSSITENSLGGKGATKEAILVDVSKKEQPVLDTNKSDRDVLFVGKAISQSTQTGHSGSNASVQNVYAEKSEQREVSKNSRPNIADSALVPVEAGTVAVTDSKLEVQATQEHQVPAMAESDNGIALSPNVSQKEERKDEEKKGEEVIQTAHLSHGPTMSTPGENFAPQESHTEKQEPQVSEAEISKSEALVSEELPIEEPAYAEVEVTQSPADTEVVTLFDPTEEAFFNKGASISSPTIARQDYSFEDLDEGYYERPKSFWGRLLSRPPRQTEIDDSKP